MLCCTISAEDVLLIVGDFNARVCSGQAGRMEFVAGMGLV